MKQMLEKGVMVAITQPVHSYPKGTVGHVTGSQQGVWDVEIGNTSIPVFEQFLKRISLSMRDARPGTICVLLKDETWARSGTIVTVREQLGNHVTVAKRGSLPWWDILPIQLRKATVKEMFRYLFTR
ncbi:MAG: hypothetical protein WAV51_00155 [Microgenomates group bacterium]